MTATYGKHFFEVPRSETMEITCPLHDKEKNITKKIQRALLENGSNFPGGQ